MVALQPVETGAGGVRRWLIILMLFSIQVINYADKSVAGLAAKSIMAELGLTPAQYGLVASSFFSLYAVGGLLVAFLITPHVRSRRLLAGLLVIWSIAQFPVAIAGSLTTLIVCRTVLGFGEGAGTPTSLNVSHEWFPDHERTLPTAVLMLGSTMGSLIAAPILSYIIHMFGWRAAFVACGAAGLLVTLLWLSIAIDGPAKPDKTSISSSAAVRGWWRDRTVIGIFLAGFSAYWVIGFMVAWLPPFIRTALGFDLITTGWLLSAIFAGHACLVLAISAVSHRMMLVGRSSRVARGLPMYLCLLGSALALVGAGVISQPLLRLVFVALGTGLPALIFPLGAAMLSEVAPDSVRQKAMTIVFSAFTVSAILSPWATGRIVETLADGWPAALLLHGGVALLGAIAAFVLLQPEQSKARLAQG